MPGKADSLRRFFLAAAMKLVFASAGGILLWLGEYFTDFASFFPAATVKLDFAPAGGIFHRFCRFFPRCDSEARFCSARGNIPPILPIFSPLRR